MRDYIQNYYQNNSYDGPVQFVDPLIARDSLATFMRQLPGVKVYYALKSFNDPRIVEALDDTVTGYDVASLSECQELGQLGVAMDRLVFANPVKSIQQIKATYALGVRRYVVQSCNELQKMIDHAPDAEILIRMKVDDTDNKTGQKFSLKFGANIETVHEIITMGKQRGARIAGLTFHVGSQCESSRPWVDAIRAAHEILAQYNLKTLDIGGGFPVDYYAATDRTFESISADIRNVLSELPASIEIIAEPGRFISARCASMSASVIGIENRDNSTWVYLDVGIFQGLYEAVEFHRLLQPISPLYPNDETVFQYVVAGPTCDGDDVVSLACRIPGVLKNDTLLLIANTGAYTESYQATLNSFSAPKKLFIS